MVVADLADLHELNAAPEMVDDALVALGRPPLDGNVMFAAGGHQPVGGILPGQLANRRRSGSFRLREMNVSAELRGLKLQAEPAVEVIQESVQVVARDATAAMYQRCVAP